jgi:transcriptional regulator with XRE-family HTH domain
MSDQPITPAVETVLTVDDLLSMGPEVDPLFVDDANYTGIKPLSEQIKNLPEATRKNIANLRAQVTRKQQELAAQTRTLETKIQQYEQERSNLTSSPWANKLKELAATAPDVDPWTPEGIEKLIEHRTAQQLQAFLEPLREQVATSQQRTAAETFMAANPDLKTDPEIRDGVKQALVANMDLGLEEAYWMVRGKVSAQRERERAQAVSQERQVRREAVSKTASGPSGVSLDKPNFVNPQTGQFDPHMAFAYRKAQADSKKGR